MPVILMTLCSVLTAAVFTIRRAGRKDVTGVFLKTLASFCFILLGLVSAMRAENFSQTWPVCAALTVCMTGDIYLDLKYVDAANADAWTAGGFVSFLLGHLGFLGFLYGRIGLVELMVAALVGLAGGVLIYVTPGLMKLNYGRFRLLSAVYAFVLITVTACAILRAVQVPGRASVLYAAGLGCFLLSDLILSRIYFDAAGKGDTKAACVLNHTLYYGAQILIALSIAFV